MRSAGRRSRSSSACRRSIPLSLAVAAVVLAVVGLAAGYLPARRAAATQPLLALRAE